MDDGEVFVPTCGQTRSGHVHPITALGHRTRVGRAGREGCHDLPACAEIGVQRAIAQIARRGKRIVRRAGGHDLAVRQDGDARGLA